MSYRAVSSEDPAGKGKCGSTEAVPFLRSGMQAAKLQGRAGRSREEVNQRILQRNDGCVRREPPFPSCGHYMVTVSHTLVQVWCVLCVCEYMVQMHVCIHVQGSEVNTSAIITLYLFF